MDCLEEGHLFVLAKPAAYGLGSWKRGLGNHILHQLRSLIGTAFTFQMIHNLAV